MLQQTPEVRLSRLEQLPAELLDHILRYVVVDEIETATCSVSWGSHFCAVAVKPARPSIALASRILRDIASPTYFAENIFVLGYCRHHHIERNFESLRSWLAAFERYATDTAHIGVVETTFPHHRHWTVTASLSKRRGISYNLKGQQCEPGLCPTKLQELIAAYASGTGMKLAIAIERLFKACYEDEGK